MELPRADRRYVPGGSFKMKKTAPIIAGFTGIIFALACNMATAPAITPTLSVPEPITVTAALPTADATPQPMGQEMLGVFPFSQGAVWTYKLTLDYDGGSQVEHWEGEVTETVTEASPAIENWIFHSVIDGVPDVAFLRLEHYYVTKGSAVFDLGNAEDAAAATNPEAVAFARNQILAWPLEIGQMWGDPDLMNESGLNVWRVDAVQSVDVPAGHFDDCYVIMMVTNGDRTFRWFCEGVGFVKMEYHHNGTPNDQVWELVSFVAGS
jgi:hypothetical protein